MFSRLIIVYSHGSITFDASFPWLRILMRNGRVRRFVCLYLLVTLLTSMNTTFGLPCWSSCFMCWLAASSMSTLMKLTWRESRFLVTLLLTYCVTKRMLTVPFNAFFGTIACGTIPFWKGTIALRGNLLCTGTIATTVFTETSSTGVPTWSRSLNTGSSLV